MCGRFLLVGEVKKYPFKFCSLLSKSSKTAVSKAISVHCKFNLTLSLRTVNSEVVTALGWDTATLVFFNNGKKFLQKIGYWC
jgi:hypothetical protein